ncbi:MAG: rutB [Solirubrobacterales bacterium]|nr:rutB [Solirubrobacterales bacterium]
MPVVTVQIWEGRGADQKRALAKALTEAMVEHGDASVEALHVAIDEYPKENWAKAGILGIDRTDLVKPADRPPAVWRLQHALLEVIDLERSLEFYVGTLGFEVHKEEPFRDGRPLVVTKQGLGLIPGRNSSGNPVEHLAFHTRNVVRLAEQLGAAGIEPLAGPEPSAYGISLYVADPDGNKIELFGSR